MPRPVVVTAYTPIPGHPRSAKAYGELGEKLFSALAFDGPVMPIYSTVQKTWLWKEVHKRPFTAGHCVADNPQKNSLEYHCVQFEKFLHLCRAATKYPDADPVIWVDYGLAHIGVTPADLDLFLTRVRQNDFAIPGCWSREGLVINDHFPCWRFAGGLMTVPRAIVPKLYMCVKRAMQRRLKEGRPITWEVNILAEVEPLLPELRWYYADHDVSLLENYNAI